tara:strand:+ start:108 stop:581 length:474 start_codon:yes stop_codon:yes gene_type:complete
MALVIEDGSIVSGANSYITIANYKSWADDRGISYSTDSKIEQSIFRAMDWFERQMFIGNKANENQPLQWPRTEALIDGYYVDATEIPNQVKTALYEVTTVDLAGNSEFNTQDRKTSKEKVGDIEVTYADNSENRIISPALTFAMNKIVQPALQVMRV